MAKSSGAASPTREFTSDELAKLPIKPPSERRLIGQKIDALDIPAKINGTARYGIDAVVEGMVYARPKIPPTRYGSVVRAVDDSAAKRVKGYLTSLVLEDPSKTVPGWVVVCATSYPAAIRAADLVKVDWAAGDASMVSEQDILDYGAKQIAAPRGGALVVDDPEVDSAFRAAASTLERTYTTNSVLHAQLEPVNALAFEKDGRFEIHTGSQAQSTILPVLARALRPAAGSHCHAHLSDRRGIRAQAQHRLCHPRRAGRQGSRQAREARTDASRRHAFRLVSLAVDPEIAAGIRCPWQGHGHGTSRVGRLADLSLCAASGHAEGA